MSSLEFVDLFRMHWNITAVGNTDCFGHKLNTFDSIDCFKIQYVFGNVECIAEYCNRKSLTSMIKALIERCVNLYKAGKRSARVASMDFLFNDLQNNAEIRLHINDFTCKIIVTPKDFYD